MNSQPAAAGWWSGWRWRSPCSVPSTRASMVARSTWVMLGSGAFWRQCWSSLKPVAANGGRLPQRAHTTLYSYLSWLRTVLAAGGLGVHRRSGGYLLPIASEAAASRSRL